MTEPGGSRFDAGKPMMALLDPVALEGLATVLTMGAKKYAAHNWTRGMLWSRVTGSLLRHLFKFMRGEDYDAESGLPHIDHVLCNAMFLSHYFRMHKSLDDRCKLEVPLDSKVSSSNEAPRGYNKGVI